MWANDSYVNHAVIRSSVNMSMHFTCDRNVLGLQCHIVMYLSKYIELTWQEFSWSTIFQLLNNKRAMIVNDTIPNDTLQFTLLR